MLRLSRPIARGLMSASRRAGPQTFLTCAMLGQKTIDEQGRKLKEDGFFFLQLNPDIAKQLSDRLLSDRRDEPDELLKAFSENVREHLEKVLNSQLKEKSDDKIVTVICEEVIKKMSPSWIDYRAHVDPHAATVTYAELPTCVVSHKAAEKLLRGPTSCHGALMKLQDGSLDDQEILHNPQKFGAKTAPDGNYATVFTGFKALKTLVGYKPTVHFPNLGAGDALRVLLRGAFTVCQSGESRGR